MEGVSIRLVGRFAVEHGDHSDGGHGIPVALGSRKARRLIALLAVRRGELVVLAEIVDALWDGRPPRRPADNVATLVSRLRAALGPAAVLGGRDGYRLGSAPGVRVDLDDAGQLADEATRRETAEPALAVSAARQGLRLLGTGALLPEEPDAAWLTAARNETAVLLRSLRHSLAGAALRAGDAAAAVGAASAAVEADPLDEHAHRLLMSAHHAAGEPGRALVVYERLRATLADELGADPAAETQEVHLAVLRSQPIPKHGIAPSTGCPLRPPAVRARPVVVVGREEELRRLTAAWSAAAVGNGGLLLLTGEAGIGKTALANEAAAIAEATGGQVLGARCYASERSLFLQPLVEALEAEIGRRPAAEVRELAGNSAPVLARLLPAAAAVLGDAGPEQGSAEMERRRAYDAVIGFVLALATGRTTLLWLDDLHNAGLATVELVHYLARRAARSPLLLLATMRAEEGADTWQALADVATRCEVGPLSPNAVGLLASRAGQARLAEDVVRRTRGHTLFVVETLRGLVAGESGVPDSLRAAVLARVRRAGTDVERTLRAGAVLGANVDPTLVAAMLDSAPAATVAACERALDARLLVTAGREYEFANDLVQEVLYATTPEPTRASHHRRAADLLDYRPEAVAAHAAATEDWDRAAGAWLRSGEQALARYAAADAHALLSEAMVATRRAGPTALIGRILIARGRAHYALGGYAAALDDLREALAAAREAGDRESELSALRELGQDPGHDLPAAVRAEYLATGMRLATALGDDVAMADLLAWRAILASNRLRFADAIGYGRRSVRVARATGDEGALAAGLDGLKTGYAYLGELGELTTVIEELEPLLRRRQELDLLFWTILESAFPAVAAANWDEALARIGQALVVNRRSGYSAWEAWPIAHQGWVQRMAGRYEEAVTLGRQGHALAERAAHPWCRSVVGALLATTLAEVGEGAEAVAVLRQVCTDAERDGFEAYRLRCLAPLAELTGSTEMLDQAERLLVGISAPPRSAWLLGADAYLAVARMRLGRGEPARAREVLAPLLAAADRLGWRPIRAAASLVDAQAAAALGEPSVAAAALRLAASLGERYGMPHVAARATALAGEHYSSSASRIAARRAPPGATGR